MTFPDQMPSKLEDFFDGYIKRVSEAYHSVDLEKLDKAINIIENCIKNNKTLYVCGNGGSTSIANHFYCDYLKGTSTDTKLKPKIISLSSNTEIITAISNDISYDQIFAYQLERLSDKGDVILTISASGNSDNIVNAINFGRSNDLVTISMTGFEGGRSSQIADINIHVKGTNYGIVEDSHHSLMHIITQFIRVKNMPSNLISQKKF